LWPFEGVHLWPFEGVHLWPFEGVHLWPFEGVHLWPFWGVHLWPFEGVHLWPFWRVHSASRMSYLLRCRIGGVGVCTHCTHHCMGAFVTVWRGAFVTVLRYRYRGSWMMMKGYENDAIWCVFDDVWWWLMMMMNERWWNEGFWKKLKEMSEIERKKEQIWSAGVKGKGVSK
jgi:hypothetical protein